MRTKRRTAALFFGLEILFVPPILQFVAGRMRLAASATSIRPMPVDPGL